MEIKPIAINHVLITLGSGIILDINDGTPHAIGFNWGSEIWECKATDVKDFYGKFYQDVTKIPEYAEHYWNKLFKPEQKPECGQTYPGTVVCSSVTPIRRVN